MTRRWAFAVSVILLAAGCLDDRVGPPALVGALGSEAILIQNNTTLLLTPLIEGYWTAPGASTQWSFLPSAVQEGRLAIPKNNTGPGGGTTIDLGVQTANLTVRFAAGGRLPDYRVRWALLNADALAASARSSLRPDAVLPNSTLLSWAGPYDADAPYAMPLAAPGAYLVYAQLVDPAGLPAGFTKEPLRATLGLRWTIDSSVFPLKTLGPNPPNYEQMADRLRFPGPSWPPGIGPATLAVSTQFRGSWTPRDGTNVDLEVAYLPHVPHRCSSQGGGRTVPFPLLPDTGQASESVAVPLLVPATLEARVGSLSEACPDTGILRLYHNAGPVPYRLELSVEYPPWGPVSDPAGA